MSLAQTDSSVLPTLTLERMLEDAARVRFEHYEARRARDGTWSVVRLELGTTIVTGIPMGDAIDCAWSLSTQTK